ncbi:TPA: restriction endonuclease subunit S [Enterococcus faecalis]|nr:restriction endonuclease subunit S [Enterococcus faecalis]EHL2448235.1 restriction endonuclease subunit S [Enterococcus faecalis]EKF8847969.1 restriction endonuclease subunit S [Enterococcus faecalis]HAP4692391.1 restriction endonuclease subunit S [Enterococcus faecalis]
MENLFNYNWELCKFERIFEKVKSYSLSREVETNEFTGMKYIHYGDIHTKKADKVSENSNIPNIIKKNFALLEIGDLILTDASEDYKGIATPAVIRENTSFDIVAGLHTIALRPKNIDPMFLYYLIKAPTFRKYGYKVGTGMKVFGISSSKVLDFTTYIPKNDETKLVSSFLEKIDYALDLHQRKLEQLKEFKKAYLQVMFPEKDERVPKLRFADFEEEWELRKLGDITKISTGKLDANAMVENGKYDFYTSGIKKYRIDVPAFEGPAITIAGNGATVGYMHLADNKFNAYQRTYVLQEFVVDRSFLFSEVGNKLPKKINQEARTGNIPYIVMDMLTELKLSIPQDEAEQSKIGSFFKQIDKTIALHQNKLEQLKDLKTAYLQNMFI